MMSRERLDEIRARCHGPTAGPWLVTYANGPVVTAEARHMPSDTLGVIYFDTVARVDFSDPEDEANGAFIAHARQDVPELLDEVDWLRAKLLEVCTHANELSDQVLDYARSIGASVPPTLHDLPPDSRGLANDA